MNVIQRNAKDGIRVLTQAKHVLEENDWTKGALFRDNFGNITDSKVATCFCGMGALIKAARELGIGDNIASYGIAEVTTTICRETPCTSLARFNDHIAESKQDVIDMFDRTIKRLEAR